MDIEKPKFTEEEYKQHFEAKEKALQDVLESKCNLAGYAKIPFRIGGNVGQLDSSFIKIDLECDERKKVSVYKGLLVGKFIYGFNVYFIQIFPDADQQHISGVFKYFRIIGVLPLKTYTVIHLGEHFSVIPEIKLGSF